MISSNFDRVHKLNRCDPKPSSIALKLQVNKRAEGYRHSLPDSRKRKEKAKKTYPASAVETIRQRERKDKKRGDFLQLIKKSHITS
ncbi:hypothetical protein ASPZODRAFT_279452 [Penicilliopsis zonata CBS 506.65]|uniref:Uncharacterized protein n=1 Tax=Penicilliopsis zonata CBS 506.65 TaxID=1073090 RepID=A0A1L9SUP9_9EURO|nr:hypothetical protein ASPZODRAFT_279452 [Penicilliopsis zonata CBS 506.65]OJJ50866.1 hypothetical protein ASPZODRAFT_279452 [Penicilliopsis zonata CBS 506.65]